MPVLQRLRRGKSPAKRQSASQETQKREDQNNYCFTEPKASNAVFWAASLLLSLLGMNGKQPANAPLGPLVQSMQRPEIDRLGI